eukprot:1810043-Alexandrium_andersonii.AAC.1
MESPGAPAPSAPLAEDAVAGWGSPAVVRYTSAALRAIARLRATPSAAPCAGGLSLQKGGGGSMPGRLRRRLRPRPS